MKKILLFSLALASFISCDSGDRLPNDTLTNGSKIAGFQNKTENFAYFTNEGPVVKMLAVKMIGLGDGNVATSDIVLTYEADPMSSATENVEYSFVDASKTVTIKAGSSFAMIPINVNTGQLNPTSKTDLYLKLKSSNPEVVIGEQYKFNVISFVGCQSQIVAGSYSMLSTAGYSSASQTISVVDVNVFEVAFPAVAAGGQPIPMQFSDVCGDLTLLGWDFSDSYLCFATDVHFGNTGVNQIVFEGLKTFNGLTTASPILFDRKTTTYTKN